MEGSGCLANAEHEMGWVVVVGGAANRNTVWKEIHCEEDPILWDGFHYAKLDNKSPDPDKSVTVSCRRISF